MILSGKDVQKHAQNIAEGLPGAKSGYPFTQHLLVWKVVSKVFLIVTEDDPQLEIITVKVDPDRGEALRREHDAISRGHYLNKDHWISIGAGKRITRALVHDLVEGSFELAEEQLPINDRPE